MLVLSMEERGVDADAVLEINDALEVWAALVLVVL